MNMTNLLWLCVGIFVTILPGVAVWMMMDVVSRLIVKIHVAGTLENVWLKVKAFFKKEKPLLFGNLWAQVAQTRRTLGGEDDYLFTNYMPPNFRMRCTMDEASRAFKRVSDALRHAGESFHEFARRNTAGCQHGDAHCFGLFTRSEAIANLIGMNNPETVLECKKVIESSEPKFWLWKCNDCPHMWTRVHVDPIVWLNDEEENF